jgi:translation initiation factor IF-1
MAVGFSNDSIAPLISDVAMAIPNDGTVVVSRLRGRFRNPTIRIVQLVLLKNGTPTGLTVDVAIGETEFSVEIPDGVSFEAGDEWAYCLNTLVGDEKDNYLWISLDVINV